MQFFTGHGDFQFYLHRFTLRPTSVCRYCSADDTSGPADDIPHRLFICPRYVNLRADFCRQIGVVPTTTNELTGVLHTRVGFDAFETFATQIVRLNAPPPDQ